MTEQNSTPQSETESENSTNENSIVKAIKKVIAPVVVIFDKILPPYEPRINLEERLVGKEQAIEHAIIRHFSEIQLVIGLLSIFFGPLLQSAFNSSYFLFFTVMGIMLLLSAYEMEEIYVTTHRIMVRRVGMIERIIRVPSDEEHSLEHVVSFQVGRAPVNIVLVIIGTIGFTSILAGNLSDFTLLIVLIPTVTIFIYGLRINRRALTLHLAGGLSIIMGIRKGVPKRIISAIQVSIYEDQPTLRLEKKEEIKPASEYDEQPAKDLDNIK